MVFCCEFPFSLFHSVVFLTLALFPLFWSAMPQALNSSSRFIFFFKLQGPGEMARLYLNWDSQSASCIIMRKDISIHTGLFLSLRTFVLLVRPNTFVSSVWPQRPGHCFPHTIFFLNPAFTPNSYTIPLFFPPHLFSVDARVPCFPLGCPVGCVNVPFQLCNIISWVVASCSVPLHNLSAPVCHSMRVPFLCLFEAQIWSPNGDGIKLGADNWAPHYPTSPHRSSLPAVRPVT